MKRFLINTWVLVVMLPLYVLVLIMYACNWIAKLLVRPLNGAKIKSYKWFDNLDRRIYDLYCGLWR
jgi:hypothetical protein